MNAGPDFGEVVSGGEQDYLILVGWWQPLRERGELVGFGNGLVLRPLLFLLLLFLRRLVRLRRRLDLAVDGGVSLRRDLQDGL